MANTKFVESGDVYGNFETKWFWKTKNGERIWKCICLRCGGSAYVRENGLKERLADDCGCSSRPPTTT